MVFQADQPRRRLRGLRRPPENRRHVDRRDDPATAPDRSRDGAGNDREAIAFRIVDMGVLLDDDFSAAAIVGNHRHEIGHRARRKQHRTLLARHCAGETLQLGDRGIIAAARVAQARFGQRLHHRGRRERHCIAAEIVGAHREVSAEASRPLE
jgi:hypothetical protein